ncbi:MAG: L,D-transpeptidase [Mariprofundaceae bacterium]
MIVVSIAEQMLRHRDRAGRWRAWPVSTSANGPGNRRGSFQTPTGRHRIHAKIGADMPEGTIFRGRRPIGLHDGAPTDEDLILTRILWLEGCETGVNRRGAVDTRRRYIYIHGTPDEARIGQPASHGCIRMRNADIVDLFERVREGERVYIRSE